ncbi:MAG: hypothetical protein ACT452_15215 [Microthrixaceae bacterium]
MSPLTTTLRSLGNARALTNAQAQLDERSREAWLIAGLVSRLDERDRQTTAAAPTISARGA